MGARINLSTLSSLFYSLYCQWSDGGYFQEHLGYSCVDQGDVPGKLGNDVQASMLFHLRKENLWPFPDKFEGFSEDDLFDVIEFLYDHFSKPTEGYFHNFAGCGWHYHTFDERAGKAEYRERVNLLLETYKDGYELSEQGEILQLAQPGTSSLLSANLPTKDANITERVNAAIAKFRRYRSTISERREAIRDLADVLEYIRPTVKNVLNKQDEADLFNIANNFGIRHHNQQQKTDYDASIWLSWMFYYYLATIHACMRMQEKQASVT